MKQVKSVNRRGHASRSLKSAIALSLLAAAITCCSAGSAMAGDIGLLARAPSFQASHVPEAVRNGQALLVSPMATSQRLELAINLPHRNQADLDKLLHDLYDPQSPSFHQYLSVEEFTDRFAPTQSDYDTVIAWAKANGLEVTGTTPNRRLIHVNGAVDVVNRAFGVSMSQYQHPTEDRTFFSADREPSAIGLDIPLLQISGLNNFNLPHSKLHKGKSPIAHTTGSGPSGEFLPSDMRAAYYGSGSLNGSGQTIGIFSFDGYQTSDVSLYYSSTGTSSSVPVNNVLVNGYNGACVSFNSNGTINTSVCDDGEQILDIVNAIGMAPGITQILFYEGDPSSSTADTDELNRMVTDNTAKVISCSWGWGANQAADDAIFQQMQAQGQTFLSASGDSGAWGKGSSQTIAAEYPSQSPYITQVGATDLTTTGPGGTWSSETAWSYSGGGFVSSEGESAPSWQLLSGVINSSNKGSTSYRNAPDVAAEGNFDNPTVSNGQFLTGYGGTSFAAPRWAGFIALANQQSVTNGKGTLGFINPTLYSLGTGSSYTSEFHDITSGSNPAVDANQNVISGGPSFNAVTGYDLVTGWGSPNGPALINALAGGSGSSGNFSLSDSPGSVSVTQGGTATSTISVSDLNGFSGSVALSASGLPSGVTASFSPSSTTSSSTLTLTASSSAAAGTYTVTITGTSGSLTNTTTLSVTVSTAATPSFSLSDSPGSVAVTQGSSATSTVSVADQNGFTGSVALSASGLPSGVTAAFSPSSTTSTSTLTLTASSTAATGTSTVTITGTSGSLTKTTTLSLTVNAAGGTPTQLLGNTGFETGKASPWTMSSGTLCTTKSSSSSYCGSGESAHAGSWFAWLDGYGSAHTDTVSQQVAITSGKTQATLSYYLHIDTTKTTAADTLTVQVLNTSGTVLATVGSFTNLNANSGYTQQTANLAAYIGQTVVIKFTGKESSSSGNTDFTVDDITLTVQ
jgi:subtilase family serine protease